MAKSAIIFLSLVVAALVVVILVVWDDPQVSTLEIDRDRVSIIERISIASAESEKYSGGVLKALIDVRVAALQNTLAMLDQKRASFIRRISLDYTIDGHGVAPATEDELKDIIDDIQQAERKVDLAKADAAKYTGGLLQIMELVKVATDEVAVSQLRLKFYAAKYGMAAPVAPPEQKSTQPKSPGAIVKDRDAL
jgi:formate-dependent nitrite reductase cytochrome c552 subunit